MKKYLCVVLISFLPLCAFANELPLESVLDNLKKTVTENQSANISMEQSIRNEALERAAYTYGAQSGRYYRLKQLERNLFSRIGELNSIYNFSAMYLDHGLIQPPILDVRHDVLNISHVGQMRDYVDTVYRVLVPASFKAHPLTWQSFLISNNLIKPSKPRMALLPNNENEKTLWKRLIQNGWYAGINEANAEFEARLNSLDSAYQGMVLYALLSMQGMIEPVTLKTSNQVTDTDINGQTLALGIHKQVITKSSYFIAKPNHWKALVYPQKFTLRA